MKLKKIYTVIAVILLIGIYLMIFKLSAEDAQQSSKVSQAVTAFVKNLYDALFSSTGGTTQGNASGNTFPLEAFLRKLAHFTEYFCVGFLSYSIVKLWVSNLRKGTGLVMLQLLLSASLDEFHQYFVPGRNASIRDVCIDCMGGILGMILIGLIFHRYWAIKGYR